jgi:D-alanyl-D-alanine carboxypeptidase (penicillin-binding protein 5/6)
MNLAPGQRLSLRELFLGLAVFSGNDASAAVALRFAPTIDEFVDMMNYEARAMGLSRTRFVDASGYSEHNWTTAREFAEFSRIYIANHPQSMTEFHSVMEMAFPLPEHVAEQFRESPRTRVQRNRNTLLGSVEGVDGLKTGFIFASGFNISLTAERDGTRFIAIIMGAPGGWGGDRIRDEDGRRLLEWAFSNYRTLRPQPYAPEPVRVWKGRKNYVNTVLGAPLEFTTLIERGEGLNWFIEKTDDVIAPLPAFSPVGSLVLYDNLGELRRIPLLTEHELERGGFFRRLFDAIRLFFRSI